MLDYLLFVSLALLSCYWFLRYFLENGYYFPISRRYGARRYAFPEDEATVKKIVSECRQVCRTVLNGDILKYPFLQEHATSLALSKRILTIFYERSDPQQTPVAFHAPFVFTWKKQRGLHCGLMMVVPEHQKQGLQGLTVWSVAFYHFFHGIDIVTDITGYAGGATYLTIQDRTQSDAYPVWRHPEVPPKQWHLDVTQFMLTHYRGEFGCSALATLDEKTLVVVDSMMKEGDGAWQLIESFDVQHQRSRSVAKQQFIDKRMNGNKCSEQFFLGRPALWKWISSQFGLVS